MQVGKLDNSIGGLKLVSTEKREKQVSFQCPTVVEHPTQGFSHYFTAGLCTTHLKSSLIEMQQPEDSIQPGVGYHPLTDKHHHIDNIHGNECDVLGCCNVTTCQRWFDHQELNCPPHEVKI